MALFRNAYLGVLRWIMILCLAGILGLVFANVIMRYAFSSGIYLTEGLSGLLFVWMTFIGALIGLYGRAHIGVNGLVKRVPVQMQKLLFVLAHTAMLYVTYRLLLGSWQQMMINLNVISPATRLPIAALYAAGVFFAAMSGLFIVQQLALLLAGRLPSSDLVSGISEEEADATAMVTSMAQESRK